MLCDERVVDVLQVGTDCNFVALVVLIYERLVSANWSEIDVFLFVQLPPVVDFLQLLWVKLLILRC